MNKIRAAVAEAAAALLARESNEESTAESLAEELAETVVDAMVETYEAIQARSYNLVVVASFQEPGGNVFTAAVGPLSTRAQQRARDMGERFAWDYKTRQGTGRFTLVPLVRNANEAWDEARRASLAEFEHTLGSVTPGVETSYEPMRFELSDEVRARIRAQWQMDPGILVRKYGPACLCGLPDHPRYNGLGDPADMTCPLHPEREGEGDS